MDSTFMIYYVIDNYLFPYFIIGVVVTLLVDLSIYYSKSSSRLTFAEIWGSIIFWPLVLFVFLKGFFNQD